MTTYDALAKRVIGLQTEYRPLLEQRRRQAEQAFEEEEIGPSAGELDAMYQRFLALDEHKIPSPGTPPFTDVAPHVRNGFTIYVLDRMNYRGTRWSIQLHLSWGKPLSVTDADEMLRWLDEYEERASHVIPE